MADTNQPMEPPSTGTPKADETPQLSPGPNPKPENQSFLKNRRLLLIFSTFVLVLAIVVIGIMIFSSSNHNSQKKVAETSATPSADNKVAAKNTWKSTVSPTAIPLGDGNVSSKPKVGYIYSCSTNFRGGGAMHSGDWLDAEKRTWNSTTKVAVKGSIQWPNANYSIKTSGSNRIVTTNDLPNDDITGVFPIATSDPAYQYDRNPNAIGVQNLSYTLPLNPTAAKTPQCTSLGAIGVLTNGTLLYNGLDAAGRDAVAHETQDSCNGHPDGGEHYHYHNISSCIEDSATGSSTLVGYALDGYGIYVERDDKGNLPTNSDLDECHGRTSKVEWNGKVTEIFHYSATLEYPFTIGCFHGTPIINQPGPRSM